jgi:hypothetical protein
MDLKKWNEEVFDNIDCNKSKLIDNLRELDAIEVVRALGSVNLAKKGEVSREYSLYLWTVAYLSPLSLSYADFLSRFSFSG